MAYGSKEGGRAAGLILALTLAAAGAPVGVDVVHQHFPRGSGTGVVFVDDSGISYKERSGKPARHDWSIRWDGVQQVWVSKHEIRVLTYADSRWKLGADREVRLRAAHGATMDSLIAPLKRHLGAKLVAAVSAPESELIATIPVKLRKGFGGSEGELLIQGDGLVYQSRERSESRTWTWADIDNVSSSGPYDLTVTTFERSKRDYGDRKSFNFQLKRRMEEAEFNAVWRRVIRAKEGGLVRSYGDLGGAAGGVR